MRNNNIYLTFDDGPTPGVTPWVLSLLTKYNFKATFFCLGKNAEQYPELLGQIKTSGHAIGNHGYKHLNGWKTPVIKYLRNTKKGYDILNTSLFRPPYGKLTPMQWLLLHKKYKLVYWNYLSKDYMPIDKQAYFLDKLKKHTKNNRIVVFHDSVKAFPTLQKYLESYLLWLKEEKYEIVKIKD